MEKRETQIDEKKRRPREGRIERQPEGQRPAGQMERREGERIESLTEERVEQEWTQRHGTVQGEVQGEGQVEQEWTERHEEGLTDGRTDRQPEERTNKSPVRNSDQMHHRVEISDLEKSNVAKERRKIFAQGPMI